MSDDIIAIYEIPLFYMIMKIRRRSIDTRKAEDKQWSGLNTVKPYISPSDQNEKEAHTHKKWQKLTKDMHTVPNRRLFPKLVSFIYRQ